MKSLINQPSELGPWGLESQIISQFNSQKEKEDTFCLPRMTNRPNFSLKKTQQKQGFHLKVSPFKFNYELSPQSRKVKEEIAEAHQSKTISFDPPVISFYNKNHPKFARKHRQHNSLLHESPQSLGKPSESPRLKKMSRVQLICVERTDEQNHSFKKEKVGPNREFAKKRSLLDLMRYIKKENSVPKKNVAVSLNMNINDPQFSQITQDLLERSSRYESVYKEIFDCEVLQKQVPSFEHRRNPRKR